MTLQQLAEAFPQKRIQARRLSNGNWLVSLFQEYRDDDWTNSDCDGAASTLEGAIEEMLGKIRSAASREAARLSGQLEEQQRLAAIGRAV